MTGVDPRLPVRFQPIPITMDAGEKHTSRLTGLLRAAATRKVLSVPSAGTRRSVLHYQHVPEDFFQGLDDEDYEVVYEPVYEFPDDISDDVELETTDQNTIENEIREERTTAFGSLLATFNPEERTHAPVGGDIAQLVNALWKSQHKLADIYDKFKRPSNVSIFKVDVNEEFLMGTEDNRPVRQRDMKLRASQGAIAGATWATVATINSLAELEAKSDSKVDFTKFLPTIVESSVAVIKFLAHANMHINNYRRQNLKSIINPKYHALCKDSPTLPSPFLFGDELTDKLRTLSQAVRVSRQGQRFQGYRQQRPVLRANQRFNPYLQSQYRPRTSNQGFRQKFRRVKKPVKKTQP